MKYFFDTSAIIELVNGNIHYQKFRKLTIATSTLHVAEFYFYLLREHNRQTADYWIRKLNFELANVLKLSDVIDATNFKFRYKKEKLSYIDCIGYVLAKKMGVKFLTGDAKFKTKDNVEFVK